MAKKKLTASVEAKRALIEPDDSSLSIHRQCALLGLNRASYYCSFAKLGQGQMGLDSGQTLPLLNLLDYPGDRFAQGFAEHGPTGLADGRQACLSPFLRTVVPQLGHQGAVRQEY